MVLTEDSTTGKDFLEKFFKSLDIEATVMNSEGISDMLTKIDKVIPSMNKKSDLLYISLDNINGLEYDSEYKVNETETKKEEYTWAYKVKRKCAIKYPDYNICISTYYCIEEVLLSYRELSNHIGPKYRDTLLAVQEIIYNEKNYYTKIVENYKEVLNLHFVENQEKLCKIMFSVMTQRTLFGFFNNKETGKAEIGKCWLEPCCINQIPQMAEKCPRHLLSPLMSSKDKANDIYNRTLLQKSMNLEDIRYFSSLKYNNSDIKQVKGFFQT